MADIATEARGAVVGILGETVRRIQACAAAGQAVAWPEALEELRGVGEERLGVAIPATTGPRSDRHRAERTPGQS